MQMESGGLKDVFQLFIHIYRFYIVTCFLLLLFVLFFHCRHPTFKEAEMNKIF